MQNLPIQLFLQLNIPNHYSERHPNHTKPYESGSGIERLLIHQKPIQTWLKAVEKLRPLIENACIKKKYNEDPSAIPLYKATHLLSALF